MRSNWKAEWLLIGETRNIRHDGDCQEQRRHGRYGHIRGENDIRDA